MVKKINISATYNNQSHIFECDPHDFLEGAAQYFHFDVSDIELYSVNKGQRCRITPLHITDLMKIEIIPKNNVGMGTQGTLHNFFTCESPQQKIKETIVAKLRNNTPLTGSERKTMVGWLEICSCSANSNCKLPRKRKIDEVNSKPDVCNKKVQVDIASTHYKDSFAQTDFVNTLPEEAHAKDQSISNKIKKLAVNSNVNKEEVTSLMAESFDDRRNFIYLKSPPIAALKDKYPLLFCLDEVKNELGRIFYAEKCDEFIANMHMYAPLILQKWTSSDDLLQRTEKYIERAHTQTQKDYAKAVGSIFILTNLMEEQWSFIHLKDYGHPHHDIYPHIDASYHSLKELFFDNFLYHIYVEGQLLCEANNLLEAILCLVASFFIFNIDYPPSCRRTMIMFEKLYLNANDTTDLDDLTIQMLKLLQLEAKSAN